jgi:enediyne biosynthesis protein E4
MKRDHVAFAFRRKILMSIGMAICVLILPAEAGSDLQISVNAQSPLFVDAAETTGLEFTHITGETGQYYMAEQMGAGVALFDYDGDDDLDVFLVQGGSLGKGTAGGAGSRLFRNDLSVAADGKRTLRFTDVTAAAGVAFRGYGMGAAVGDYDNDARPDLFVTGFETAALYHNNGNGTFTDVTVRSGIRERLWSTSAAFLDYDRDGRLDLFVARYLDFTLASNKTCHDAVGARDYCSPRSYKPVPAALYRNAGNGLFTNVSDSAGISKAYGAGLGVSTGDYNGDGWLDIYVANDATPNQLWINTGKGTFRDEGMLSGSAVNAAGNPEGSMGIASGDFDADGDEDLFVTNILGETFALYANDGKGVFEDLRMRSGLAGPTAPYTGFATDWLDYDNDGRLDLFVANGAVNIVEAQRGKPRPFRMKNQLFRNTGNGRFVETSGSAGPAFARTDIARGAAFGDIDNDGDVDIVVTNNGGPANLLLNQSVESGNRNHWIEIALRQPTGNRLAFGAWVGIERAGQPTLWRRVRTDGSYLSASDARLHFGLGASPSITAVLIQWPDGQRDRRTGIAGDRRLTITR